MSALVPPLAALSVDTVPALLLAAAGIIALLPFRVFGLWVGALVALGAAGLAVVSAMVQGGYHAPAMALMAVTVAAALLSAGGAILRDLPAEKHTLVVPLVLAGGAGAVGAVGSDSFVALLTWLGLTFAAYLALAAQGGSRDRGGSAAALQAQIQIGVSLAMALMGAGLIGQTTGAAGLTDLATPLSAAPGNRSVLLGLGLLAIGLSGMAAVAPMHLWAAPLQARGPSYGLVLLGTIAPLAALAGLVRLVVAAGPVVPGFALALALLGALSAVIGSLQAMAGRDFRRVLAYALTAQAGVALLAVALGGAAGLSAGLFHLVNLVLVGLLVWLVAAGLPSPTPTLALDGLLRRSPFRAACLLVGLLSLLGAPLTAGFLSKWRMIEALIAAGHAWAAALVILVALASVFYCGRLIERAVFRAQGAAFPTDEPPRTHPLTLVPTPSLALALAVCLYLGLEARGALAVAGGAAQAVLAGVGGGP